ncbi:SurA N-terminal domain-containing protein [Goekera deserti]|uniref:Peptidyl-prolyl cis-trans isomerase SurA n=1 Tax=Goekera deserti TaxID=2497753 RepID=A0A7K3WGV5_9ACTN|nr:SurA N-terminal domain-containing protein [Goekera deserti]NDI48934.1 hypothetical protein [Goekera deserti]NEL55596.1 hypothetical protein [Goekera deserti]
MLSSRRLTAVLALGVSGTLLLSGCRSDASVAAYVGDSQVTRAELDRAVADRLADPDIATFAGDDDAGYQRFVLGLLVQEDVYAAVADRYDVQVSDDDARARIDQLLAGQDEAATYQQLAQQNGVNAEDVLENVRQQMVREQVAVASGQVDLSESALRERFDASREGLAKISLGFITVPDDATAQAVLGQLTADPASYPALAAQYAGQYTLPALEDRAPDEIPQALLDQVAGTDPGNGFTLAVPETGGVVVAFVGGIVYPTFEGSRAELEAQAAAEAADSGMALVADVREDLDVTVNPRYGVADGENIVAGDGGVVDVLTDGSGAAEDPIDDTLPGTEVPADPGAAGD